MLNDRLTHELTKLYQEMRTSGELLSREQLGHYYAFFRERFGPEKLANLDGQDLLYKMHGLGEEHRDSLVYWLEFKNDEEFPTRPFGSISGGSALKYGIYQRKEDGAWMTGSSSLQTEITEQEAIEVARRHRDQLFAGSELLEQLPQQGSDADYGQLQEQLYQAAPDICDTAWAHKYFSLLYPAKLDDYHVEHYQRFHLIKLLIVPPAESGRYVAAGRFVAVANGLELPMNHLTSVLNRRDGRPYQYWRIGTRLGDTDSRWELMRDQNCVAIGWDDLGDLHHISRSRESKEAVREALQVKYPNTPQTIGRKTQEIFNFVTGINEGDLVLPSDGMKVLGIGRVVGGYVHVAESDVPHRRPVEWLSLAEWQQPKREGIRTTVFPIRKHVENCVEAERQILLAPDDGPLRRRKPGGPPRLQGIPGRIQAILDRKKQVILYGPPGTGKTYWARIAAQELAAHRCFGRPYADLDSAEQSRLWANDSTSGALVRMCTFHPAYGYEDFLEGYRPDTVDKQLVFYARDGIFKRMCNDARQHPELSYYLIIDEINRGDIPRIFGELLTILEQDKRGQAIILPLSGEAFAVPDNVYVIGTMNTADRSIALLDTALRRRFGFIELMPDTAVLKGAVVANAIPLGNWLEALNERVLEHVGRDARNLQIGHAYFLDQGRPVDDISRFARILQDDILPLLEEYCYEDYSTLGRILGADLVDERHQRIHYELFSPDRRDELIDAILRPSPELIATIDVVESDAATEILDEEVDDSDQDEEAGG